MGDERGWDRLIGERVRLRELRILHAVIRAGSMAKAAAALSMTQPAVSQAIGTLESALGVKLLERGAAGVSPTEFGETMLRHALEAMDALSEGVREVASLADPAQGRVVVGTSESYIAGGVLTRAIGSLVGRYPRMRIDVVESNTAAMRFEDLRERRVDVMLGRVAPAHLPDDLQADVLQDETLLLVTGAQHGWAHDPGISLETLSHLPWVLAPAGSAVHELVAAAFSAEGLAMPAVTVTTYSMTLRLQLLVSGPYVTAFPRSLVINNAERWPLVVLPPTLGRPLPVTALTLRSRWKSRTIQAFIAAVREAGAEDSGAGGGRGGR